MGEATKIEWADSTLNFWISCQETGSPACVGCYARERSLRYAPKGTDPATVWGPKAPRVEVKSWRATLRKISKMAEAAFAAGRKEPWFVFVNSLSDFFDNQADPVLRAEAFREFAKHPHLTFLLLTKRPQNIVKMWEACKYGRAEADHTLIRQYLFPHNIALGCTVVTQAEADRDVRHLLAAAYILRPAFVFLSMEPLAEMVNIRSLPLGGMAARMGLDEGHASYDALHPGLSVRIGWVITGGATDQGGFKAEPTDPMAFIDLQIQCEEAGVPFLFKQWGEWAGVDPKGFNQINDGRSRRMPSGMWVRRLGKKAAGRTLRGKIHDARPMLEVPHVHR